MIDDIEAALSIIPDVEVRINLAMALYGQEKTQTLYSKLSKKNNNVAD